MAEHISHEDYDSDMELDLDLYADFDYDAFVSKFSDVDIKPRYTKSEPQSRSNQPSPNPPAAPKKQRTPLRPLPDEVLSAIFSHLPQATLRTCASLVCRDWARVCHFVVRRVGVWKTMGEDGHQELLSQMPKINTLICWILQDPELPPEYWKSIDPNSTLKMWNKFVRAITKPLPSKALMKGTDCLVHHIKEIVIHGDYISYKRVISPLLPHLQYLRNLRLDFQRDNSSMDLFPILDRCLNLKELTVKGAINRFLIIRADSDDQELTCADVPEPPPKEELESYIHANQPTTTYSQQYGILCIVFHEVVISQRTLEHILVTCPLLRTLKVTEMKKYRPVPSQPGLLRPVHLDRGRITRLVREYCPRMEWLALLQSLDPNQVWNTTDRPIKESYNSQPLPPAAYEWFIAKETCHLSVSMEAIRTRYFCKRVCSILDHITVLEITDALVHQEAGVVGQLLCLTPCLEHFRATRARLYVTDLRFKHWLPSYKTNRERRIEAKERGWKDLSPVLQASRRSIMDHVQSAREGKMARNWSHYWQCLNLQSLDLSIYGETPDISRLFTYLWLHCPVLRNLCIRCESVQMGQLIEYPEPGSHGDTASTKSNDLAAAGTSPKRFPNHLRDLRGLELLETVKIYTESIQGIVAGADFEFLRRPLDMRSQDQRQCEQRAVKLPPKVNKEVIGTIYEDDEGDDDIAVVLPFLTSIVFVYRSSPMKDDYRDVVDALEEIRPGVEFRFMEQFTSDGSL